MEELPTPLQIMTHRPTDRPTQRMDMMVLWKSHFKQEYAFFAKYIFLRNHVDMELKN